MQHVAALMDHAVFDITNPPACEHLLFGFASSVPNFHAEDGSGYKFMADAILKVCGEGRGFFPKPASSTRALEGGGGGRCQQWVVK